MTVMSPLEIHSPQSRARPLPRLRSGAISLMTMLLALCSLSCAQGQTVIVKEGQSQATIVLPDSPSKTLSLAASELQEHIKLISGAQVAIVNRPAKPAGVGIYIGSTVDGRSAPADPAKDDFALHLRVTPNAIELLGNTEDGVLMAAYELLEQLGVRWYMPGPDGVDVIESKTVTAKLQDFQDAPKYKGRILQAVGDRDWASRMRLGGMNAGGHGLGPTFDQINEPELFYRYLNDGRISHQEKVSEPEVFKRVIEFWREKLKANPEMKFLNIGPHDGAGFGTDPWDATDFDPILGQVATTDRYIKFFNKVLEEFKDEYPDLGVAFYAYTQEMRPPVREKPNKHILPMLAAIGLDRFHSINNPLSWEKKYLKTVIEGWQALGVNMMFRGYLFNLADHGLPFSMIDIVKNEWPYYYDKGFIAMRVECIVNWAYHGPALYLAARLFWDPHADADKILEEYWTRFYGPAAGAMKEHFDIVENAYIHSDYYTGNVFDVPKIITPEVRKEMNRSLKAAEKAVKGDKKYEPRVNVVRIGFEYGEANFKMMDAFMHADFKEAKAQHDDITNNLIPTAVANVPPVIAPRTHVGYYKRFWGRNVDNAAERITNGREIATVLPDEWLTFLDPYNSGESLFLFDPALGTQSWRPMKTYSDSSSNQGLRYYKDTIWYRTKLTVPAKYQGRLLRLWLGGIDDTPRIWIDGVELTDRLLRGSAPIGNPWEFDATSVLTPGKEQVIVIKVSDNAVNELGTIGITGPIVVWAENPSVTREAFETLRAEEQRKVDAAKAERQAKLEARAAVLKAKREAIEKRAAEAAAAEEAKKNAK